MELQLFTRMQSSHEPMKIQDVTEEDVYDMAVWMFLDIEGDEIDGDEIRNVACQLSADAVGVGFNERA